MQALWNRSLRTFPAKCQRARYVASFTHVKWNYTAFLKISFLCRNDGNFQSVVCLCVSALIALLSPALLHGKLIFTELEARKSK